MMDTIFRDSSNILYIKNLMDSYDLTPAPEHAPQPVITGVTVTAQVFSADRLSSLSPVVPLIQEPDQPQNYYRGILSSLVDLSDHDTVEIKYVVDGGGDQAKLTLWKTVKVVDG